MQTKLPTIFLGFRAQGNWNVVSLENCHYETHRRLLNIYFTQLGWGKNYEISYPNSPTQALEDWCQMITFKVTMPKDTIKIEI